MRSGGAARRGTGRCGVVAEGSTDPRTKGGGQRRLDDSPRRKIRDFSRRSQDPACRIASYEDRRARAKLTTVQTGPSFPASGPPGVQGEVTMLKQGVSCDTKREQRGPNEERRASVRHPAALTGLCRAIGGPIGIRWLARVRDLSTLGIGLVAPQRLQPGTLLEIGLKTPSGSQLRTPLARVVHAEEEGNGAWVTGCAFAAELSPAELRLFRAQR